MSGWRAWRSVRRSPNLVMPIAPTWIACRGSSRAWDRAAATPTLSGALIKGAQSPGAFRRWRVRLRQSGRKATRRPLMTRLLARLDQLLSRSLGFRLAVAHRARDDQYGTR